MRVFAVALNEPNPDIARRIEKEYPDHYRISETLCLVSEDVIAEDVAVSVGIKGGDRVEGASGVVFKLNNVYSGFSARSLWDWLSRAEERQ